jgi:hypothetical protein
VLDPYEEWVDRARCALEKKRARRRSSVGGFGVFGVIVGVDFGGFGGVVCGVMKMAVGDLGVMSGEMMIAVFVVARGFAMMTCCVVVVFGCFVMMLGCLLGHGPSLKCETVKRADGLRLNLCDYGEMKGSLQLAVYS